MLYSATGYQELLEDNCKIVKKIIVIALKTDTIGKFNYILDHIFLQSEFADVGKIYILPKIFLFFRITIL